MSPEPLQPVGARLAQAIITAARRACQGAWHFLYSRVTLMHDPLPIHLSADGTVATWNPALTRSNHVVVRVCRDDVVSERRSLNSGRVRVLPGERIEAVRPVG